MIRFVLFVGIILMLLPSVAGADSLATRSKLIVGGDFDCPPYEFLDHGKATGFDIELMRAVADAMGFDVEFRLGQWNKVRQDLEQGRIDALAGMYYSADRSRLVDFSVPHTMVTSGLFVRKDSPIRSFADIRGKEIIVQDGDIIHDSLKRDNHASRIVAVTDATQVLRLLASGKHDCAVMPSRLQGEHYFKTLGLANIRTINTDLPQLRYCFAVRKGNQELLSRLDEGLKILKENGEYQKIYERWFGVYEKQDLWDAVKYYVWALAVVAGLCLAFLVWSRMLKRRVEQRTAELRRSEEALRFTQYAIDNSADYAFWMTEDGRLFYVNDAACRALGYTREELLRMSIPDIDPDYPPEVFAAHWRKLRERGSIVHESGHRAKDGRVYPVEIHDNFVVFDGKEYNCAFMNDISERKRMEEELRHAREDLEKRVEERTAELARATEALSASEQEKSLILNITDAHLIYYDPDMNILWANKAAGDSVNMSPEELRKRHCWEVWHQRKEPCSNCPVLLARDTGLPQESEVRTPDGRVWFIRAFPAKNEKGRIIGMVEFTQDFTERMQMEQALREANLVVENSPVVLFRWKGDDEWPVELVSGNIIQFGYTPDEFLSGSITYSSIILPDDLGRVTREVHDLCDGGADQLRLEYRIVTKGGDIRWVNEHTNVERDAAGGVKSFEGVVIDVTERKEIESELRKNKEKYQAIVDQIDGYLYIASKDYRIQFMNESVVKLFGYSEPGEFCYKVMHDRDSVCPDCRSNEVFEGNTVRREWFNPKNGRYYHVTDTPIFHTDGTIVRQAVATDISERRLAEEQLEQRKRQLEELNRTLEKRVEEEVAKNREKDLILIQQNRQAALGEMLDHIAHQWKQPLTAISFLVQEVEETLTCGEMTDEYVCETVAKATDLVQHMAQTIEVFRDFYRPEKEITAFSIKDSIDKALSFISPALKFHAIKLRLDVDPGLTAIGYPKEYAQVLLNVMTNARDMFVGRKTENPRLEIKAFEEGGKAVVTITDNAGGVPATIIDKVFDLYFTTRESSGGTGVGLYMSKNIIEKNMGGKLSAANVGGGAQFRIELDMSKPGFDR